MFGALLLSSIITAASPFILNLGTYISSTSHGIFNSNHPFRKSIAAAHVQPHCAWPLCCARLQLHWPTDDAMGHPGGTTLFPAHMLFGTAGSYSSIFSLIIQNFFYISLAPLSAGFSQPLFFDWIITAESKFSAFTAV